MLRNANVGGIIAGLGSAHLVHHKRFHAERHNWRNGGEAFRRVAIAPIGQEGRMGLGGYNNGGNSCCQLHVLSLLHTWLRDRIKTVSLV